MNREEKDDKDISDHKDLNRLKKTKIENAEISNTVTHPNAVISNNIEQLVQKEVDTVLIYRQIKQEKDTEGVSAHRNLNDLDKTEESKILTKDTNAPALESQEDIFERFKDVFGNTLPNNFTLTQLEEKVKQVIEERDVKKLIRIEELLEEYQNIVQKQLRKVILTRDGKPIEPEGKISNEVVRPKSGNKQYSYLKVYWKDRGQRRAKIIQPEDPPELIENKD